MKSFLLPVSLLTFHIPLFFGVGTTWGQTSSTSSATLTSHSTFASSTTTTNTSTTSSSRSANSSTTSASPTNTAQYPSLSGVPDCATQCLETAIGDANCTNVLDVNCYCPSGKFPQGIVSCISTTCPTLLNTTEQLARQFCNLTTPSLSTSLSFPTPTTTRTATTGTATATAVPTSATSSTASAAAPTKSGAAVGLGWGGRDGGRMVLVGLGVGVVGFVGGVLCI